MDAALLVRQACKAGLAGSAAIVELKGELVTVTDRHFDLAAELPEQLEEADRQPVRAALVILALKSSHVRAIEARVKKGDERAERAFQALVLSKLCEFRRRARRLVLAVRQNLPGAKDTAEQAFLAGMGRAGAAADGYKAPEVRRAALRRAQIFACMLRDAMREAEGEAAAPTPTAEAAPQARQAQVVDSSAVEFDAEGNPRMVGQLRRPAPSSPNAGAEG